MRVLLTGARGAIGRRVAAALKTAGHDLIPCTREVARARTEMPTACWMEIDFNRDIDARHWRPRLYGVDAVVNCAGILWETPGNTFEGVHALGPCALFDACISRRVKRVIQLSIAGTESRARSHLIASKRYADNFLESLDIDWSVLAAAPVFGTDNAISRALAELGRLPQIALIDTRDAKLAPVHVDDVVAAALRLLESGAPVRTRIPLVGPHRMSLAQYIGCLADARHAAPASDDDASLPFRSLASLSISLTSAGFPGRELLALARTDLTGNPAALTELLGRAPRSVARANMTAYA